MEMRAEFVSNYDGNMVINTAHIVSLYIVKPEFEAKDFRVIANLTHGTATMWRGTYESCVDYMNEYL